MAGACDPVGVAEIADRLKVKQQTVAMWKYRGKSVGLPEPRWEISRLPAWEWRDVEKWARQTGRLKGKPRRRQK